MAKLGYSSTGGRGLSYSRLQSLHACNRKYEIENVIGFRPTVKNMTFAYGHFVGAGIQEYLASRDIDKALFAGMLEFDLDDPWEEGNSSDVRNKKSFWTAMQVVEKFADSIENDYELRESFENLEVAKFLYQGKLIPALEATFEIVIPASDGKQDWIYEGHIDCVLRNVKTNEYIILELKTTSAKNIHEAQYENSDQALSYAVVLDKIVESLGGASSFSVLYLIVKSYSQEFVTMRFPKSVAKRSQWLNSLMLDIQHLELLERAASEAGIIYPKNGSSCYNFFRPCSYFGLCDLSNSRFISELDESNISYEEQDPPMFSFSIEEIIERQQYLLENKVLNKVEVSSIGDAIEEL